jgi:hypothetical protein
MVLGTSIPLSAEEAVRSDTSMRLSPVQLFAFAAQEQAQGSYDTAETALRALTLNPDKALHNEARFRLALLLADHMKRPAEAAILLRHILDEQPDAAPVRLELARIDALLGRMGAAGRELRAAQASGLPGDVSRLVRFYQQALENQRPVGGSLEVALAPDSNVNRATRSPTLGTVVGDFSLSPDAPESSGVGAVVRGQAFARLPITTGLSLLGRLSGSANLYRAPEFDDVILAPQLGPELVSGPNRLSLSAGPIWRWYGGQPYSFSVAATANWQRAVGKRTQLRVDASFASVNNLRDSLESGDVWALAAGVDQAFSGRFGGGLQVSANRQTATDPGYATAGINVSDYLFREIGPATVTLNLSYGHLEADKRLLLFADRRIDNDYAASLAATLRKVRLKTFAPMIRLRYERNASSVQIYDYKRFSGEVGVAAAF